MRALTIVILGGIVAAATPALADDALTATVRPEKPFSRHLIYGELLGKGGAYGIGYEYQMAPRLSVGGAASFAVIRDQQVTTVSPYLHANLLQGKRNALFTEVGAILAHTHLPSPVEGWDGMSDTGSGGFVTFGWERGTRHLVLRASGGVVYGEGGFGPMAGFAIGVRP
jgi:hypothetical protein